MPSIPLRSGSNSRSASVAFDENGDETSAYESAASSRPRAYNKRVKLSNAASSRSPAPASGSRNGSKPGRGRENSGAPYVGHGGEEEYQPGSIVRVKLENFVTYTAVEFFPGPSLNMVIGPNGTGKSTLVCAICLGLGWKAKHLGRAKEVEEFIKHGAEEAVIEVELAGNPEDEINPVIRRHIKRGGTKWYLNGRQTTHKEIISRNQAFSIQIDNLCQFLPQDKVSEFAALTPVELLYSTQRAVAKPYMLEYHDDLKGLRREQKTLQEKEAADKDTISSLETRQQQLRGDVDRIRERAEITQRIKLLELARPFVEYRKLRNNHLDAKNKRQEARAALAQLEQDVEPSLQALKSKQAYSEKVAAAAKERNRGLARQDAIVKAYAQKQPTLGDQIKEIKEERKSEKDKDKNRHLVVEKIERRIEQLENAAKEAPVTFDVAEFNEKIREKVRAGRALESEQSDVKDGVSRAKEAGNKKQNQLAQARRRLDNLDSQAGKQGAKLKGISHDSARAWEWIQEHQDEFERHVFGPPIIECSVTDPKYADQIESLFQRNDLLAFTCQSTADFKRLGTILYDNLKLAEINIQMCSESLESFRAPVSRDQMGQLGFTGWALDFLQGPDQVLSMLCGQSRIHATGVANEDFGDAQFEIIKNSPISSWVTNKQTFMIRRRREYGPDATSTSMRDIKPAQVWTDQPVDLTAKRELQGNIHNWTGELQAHAQEFQQGKDRVHQLATEIKALREEEQLLKSEKEERQKAITQWKGIPTRIETEKEKLQACHDTGRQVQERIAECDGQIQVIKLERAQAAIDYAAAVEVLQQLHVALYEAEIAQIEAVSDVQTLTIRSRDTQDLLITRRKELEVLEANRARMQALAKERMKTLKEIMSRANEQQTTFLSNLSEDQTLQDLENEIDSDRARLDLTHEGNTNVLAEFGHREETIRRHKERLEENEAQLSNLTRAIEEVRSKWEPELDRLVFEISAAFSRSFETIGCAGQIDVLKPDNEYAAWAIRIWVKFRENETMCVLDSQRQSGGERAVSTIFYLMSLQSLAQSPFRVVDEINQGMDPRNERLVHERMVDIACRENTSQYFLITPKLLSGLKYHERMRVMCIASGEYMPPKGRELDFRRCVDLARRIKGAA